MSTPAVYLLRLYCIFILACIQKYNSASQHDSTNQTSFHTKIATVPQAFSRSVFPTGVPLTLMP